MNGMKIRWIGATVLATLVALGGCAPSQSGGADASTEAPPDQAAPSTVADDPSDAPAENPGADDYDY